MLICTESLAHEFTNARVEIDLIKIEPIQQTVRKNFNFISTVAFEMH